MRSNVSSSESCEEPANATAYRNPFLVVLVALLSGILFGLGLIVSGMSNPAKVLNFLDVLGNWDGSLAFVMGGAVATTLVGYPLVQRRTSPVLSLSFELPTRQDIDQRLIAGAMLFGVGWGIGGYCPGPAWVSLSSFIPGSLVFMVCMLAGMWFTSNRTR